MRIYTSYKKIIKASQEALWVSERAPRDPTPYLYTHGYSADGGDWSVVAFTRVRLSSRTQPAAAAVSISITIEVPDLPGIIFIPRLMHI